MLGRGDVRTNYEFFAGIGMARLGFGPNWETVFANDISPAKAAIYRANFGRERFLCRAVEDVTLADLPPGRVDCCWLSPPCVGHSEAGDRRGFDDPESRAFWSQWKLVEALDAERRAPLTGVFENVVGIKAENVRAVEDAFTRAHSRGGEPRRGNISPASHHSCSELACATAGEAAPRCP
jgi:DNA (cytosine-5)-methyltransferase 1